MILFINFLQKNDLLTFRKGYPWDIFSFIFYLKISSIVIFSFNNVNYDKTSLTFPLEQLNK